MGKAYCPPARGQRKGKDSRELIGLSRMKYRSALLQELVSRFPFVGTLVLANPTKSCHFSPQPYLRLCPSSFALVGFSLNSLVYSCFFQIRRINRQGDSDT